MGFSRMRLASAGGGVRAYVDPLLMRRKVVVDELMREMKNHGVSSHHRPLREARAPLSCLYHTWILLVIVIIFLFYLLYINLYLDFIGLCQTTARYITRIPSSIICSCWPHSTTAVVCSCTIGTRLARAAVQRNIASLLTRSIIDESTHSQSDQSGHIIWLHTRYFRRPYIWY